MSRPSQAQREADVEPAVPRRCDQGRGKRGSSMLCLTSSSRSTGSFRIPAHASAWLTSMFVRALAAVCRHPNRSLRYASDRAYDDNHQHIQKDCNTGKLQARNCSEDDRNRNPPCARSHVTVSRGHGGYGCRRGGHIRGRIGGLRQRAAEGGSWLMLTCVTTYSTPSFRWPRA